MLARLAIIATFNVVVSLCLMAFTTAKRLDVFAVAAAYVTIYELKIVLVLALTYIRFSAVQAVFVGANNNNSPCNGGN
jgi:hypothetical protein